MDTVVRVLGAPVSAPDIASLVVVASGLGAVLGPVLGSAARLLLSSFRPLRGRCLLAFGQDMRVVAPGLGATEDCQSGLGYSEWRQSLAHQRPRD